MSTAKESKIITATGQPYRRIPKFIDIRRFIRQLTKNDQHSNKIAKAWHKYNHRYDARLVGLTGKFQRRGVMLIHLAERNDKRWPADRLQIRLNILRRQQEGRKGIVETIVKPGLIETLKSRRREKA